MKQASKGLMILSGILYLLLGIFALNNPGEALVFFVYYIGFTTLFSGIMGMLIYFKAEKNNGLLAMSIIDIIFGILFFVYNAIPVFVLIGLPFFVGIWSIVKGVTEFINSFRIRREGKSWILKMIWGILLVFAGVYFFIYPLVSTIVLVEYFGILLIVMGIASAIQGFMMFFTKHA